jgi:hypothetical protein
MTTYIIFKNDGSTSSTNEPGSEEALACEIARRVETMQNQKTSYFAINSTGKHELLEFFMGSALCTVEITAENLKIWKEDFKKIFALEKQMQEIATKAMSEIIELKKQALLSEKFTESVLHLRSDQYDGCELDADYEIDGHLVYWDLSDSLMNIFEVAYFGNF